jgi:hypothetical protein
MIGKIITGVLLVAGLLAYKGQAGQAVAFVEQAGKVAGTTAGAAVGGVTSAIGAFTDTGTITPTPPAPLAPTPPATKGPLAAAPQAYTAPAPAPKPKPTPTQYTGTGAWRVPILPPSQTGGGGDFATPPPGFVKDPAFTARAGQLAGK